MSDRGKTHVRGIVAAIFLVELEDGSRAVVELPTLDPTTSVALFTPHIIEGANREFGFDEPDRLVGYTVASALQTPESQYGETVLRMRLVGLGTRLITTEDA